MIAAATNLNNRIERKARGMLYEIQPTNESK